MDTFQIQGLQTNFMQHEVFVPLMTYVAYILVSITLTIWVARTLSKNGRYFLVRVFGDEQLADSINHLLVVGFYLINFGYASLTLKMGLRPHDPVEGMEELSVKVGSVLVVLGIMHFLNLFVFSRICNRTDIYNIPPPVRPTAVV